MKKLNEKEKDFIIKNLDLDKNDYCGYDKDYNLTKNGKVLNLLIDKLFVD